MTRYVWRDGAFRHPSTNELMPVPERAEVCCPRVMSDIEEYRSPVTGKPITSRSHRRYDLESNGCIEAPPRKPKGYKNAAFAAKRGLKLSDEARDTLPRN
jgi:hypothetical protein